MPMLKESDNLYAEALFFQIAASQTARPAKAAHARQLIKRELSKAGVSGIAYRIADGSGLSLYNYVTPELMVEGEDGYVDGYLVVGGLSHLGKQSCAGFLHHQSGGTQECRGQGLPR